MKMALSHVSTVSMLLTCIFLSVEGATEMRCPGWYMPDTARLVLHGRSCYQFVAREKYWTGARDYCQRYGGHLARVDNAELNHFLVDTLNSLTSWNNNGVWIGLHDRANEMSWRWTSGNAKSDIPLGGWTNWESSHPGARLHNFRDCVRMVRDSGWKWHETPCSLFSWTYRSICQYPAREVEVENDPEAGGQLGGKHEETTAEENSPEVAAHSSQNSSDGVTAGAVGAVLGLMALVVLIILIVIIRRRRQKQGPVDYENPTYQNEKAKQLLDDPVSPSSPSNDYVVQGSYSVNPPHVYEDCMDAVPPYDIPRSTRSCENVDNDVIEAEKHNVKTCVEKPSSPLHYLPMNGNMAPKMPVAPPSEPQHTYDNAPVDNNGYSLPTPSVRVSLPSRPAQPIPQQEPVYPAPEPVYAEIADLYPENAYATIEEVRNSSDA